MGSRQLWPLVFLSAACGAAFGAADCVAPPPPPSVDCSNGNNCAVLNVAGDMAAGNSGNFRGFADPAVAGDPAAPGTVWLAYSWPHVYAGRGWLGGTVQMAAVETRLAGSRDGGAGFHYAQVLWPDVPTKDPEGSGENGLITSETPSLAAISNGGSTTWYGSRLSYFLRPRQGYQPKYASSWQVRIAAAPTPAELAAAPDTSLGVTATAAAYQPAVRLDQLAGLPRQQCALLNNPALLAQGNTLYLIVECLAFVHTQRDFANSSIQVFATTPKGAPAGWTWRYAGVLSDAKLAAELGGDALQQPDLSLAADGKLIALLTPANKTSGPSGTVGLGCVALELSSIDPPALKRDCAGHLLIRAAVHGPGVSACTYDRRSATGIIVTTQDPGGANWLLRESALRP